MNIRTFNDIETYNPSQTYNNFPTVFRGGSQFHHNFIGPQSVKVKLYYDWIPTIMVISEFKLKL